MSISRFVRVYLEIRRIKKKKKIRYERRCPLLRNTAERLFQGGPQRILRPQLYVYFYCDVIAVVIARFTLYIPRQSFICPARDVFSIALGGTRRNGKSKPACLVANNVERDLGAYRTMRSLSYLPSDVWLIRVAGNFIVDSWIIETISQSYQCLPWYRDISNILETRWSAMKSSFCQRYNNVADSNLISKDFP